jgi:hypothetical protein
MSLLRNDFFGLSKVSKDALEKRLSNSDEYTVNEISEVSNRSEKLFPNNFEISEEQTEIFRILTKFTRAELRPRNLTSHRKYFGPVIVGIKRVLFKLLGVILKDTLQSQEVFNRYAVKALAQESSKKQNPLVR